MAEKNNSLAVIVSAAMLGVFLVPMQPFFGLTILGGCMMWGWKYYCQHTRLAALFKKFHLETCDMVPELRETRRTDESTIYRYSIPPGFSLEDFEKAHDAIEVFLNKEISIKVHSKNLIIEAYNNRLEQHNYVPTSRLQIGLGRGGKPVCVDFEKYPHLLVAGETGSGKSTLLRGMVTSMILQGYKLHLIDLKGGTEFGIFRKHPAVLNFARTTMQATDIVNEFLCEIDNRYDAFFEKGINNIGRSDFDKQVLVIDEYAELVFRNADCMNAIKAICAKGRACGCNIILATQRPDAKILDGAIKSNLTNVVGLKTINRTNSDIIGIPDLEKLRGHGHGIYKCAGQFVEFQAPYLSEDEAVSLIGGGQK